MGAPLFKTNGWAQSILYPVSPFGNMSIKSSLAHITDSILIIVGAWWKKRKKEIGKVFGKTKIEQRDSPGKNWNGKIFYWEINTTVGCTRKSLCSQYAIWVMTGLDLGQFYPSKLDGASKMTWMDLLRYVIWSFEGDGYDWCSCQKFMLISNKTFKFKNAILEITFWARPI